MQDRDILLNGSSFVALSSRVVSSLPVRLFDRLESQESSRLW